MPIFINYNNHNITIKTKLIFYQQKQSRSIKIFILLSITKVVSAMLKKLCLLSNYYVNRRYSCKS